MDAYHISLHLTLFVIFLEHFNNFVLKLLLDVCDLTFTWGQNLSNMKGHKQYPILFTSIHLSLNSFPSTYPHLGFGHSQISFVWSPHKNLPDHWLELKHRSAAPMTDSYSGSECFEPCNQGM